VAQAEGLYGTAAANLEGMVRGDDGVLDADTAAAATTGAANALAAWGDLLGPGELGKLEVLNRAVVAYEAAVALETGGNGGRNEQMVHAMC
jgi:hypothetical protein